MDFSFVVNSVKDDISLAEHNIQMSDSFGNNKLCLKEVFCKTNRKMRQERPFSQQSPNGGAS